MLGAKYDFSRDRERRAGIDDMVNDEEKHAEHIFSKFRFSCPKIPTRK